MFENTNMFEIVLVPLGVLISVVYSQKYLIQRIVALVAETFSWKGNALRWASFTVGASTGGLFYWVFIDIAGLAAPLSVYVLIGVLLIFASGFIASGDYDLQKAASTSLPEVLHFLDLLDDADTDVSSNRVTGIGGD